MFPWEDESSKLVLLDSGLIRPDLIGIENHLLGIRDGISRLSLDFDLPHIQDNLITAEESILTAIHEIRKARKTLSAQKEE